MLSIAHNDDGLSWFLRDGMPELLRLHPDAVLHVIGRGASPQVVALAEEHGDSVRLHGYVEDLDALVGSCCAMVNVLRFGSGVKIKVLDALARGLPVVTTEVGAEGIGESSPGLVVTGSAAEAGRELARLTDPAARVAASRDAARIHARALRTGRGPRGLRRGLRDGGRDDVARGGWTTATSRAGGRDDPGDERACEPQARKAGRSLRRLPDIPR